MSDFISSHIVLTAYELENGGISRVAIYLANGFAAAGHRVTLLLCTSAGERHADLKALLRPEISCEALSSKLFPSRALGQIACLGAYRRWLRRECPDIVMSTANNIAWYSCQGLQRSGLSDCALYIKTTNPIIREKDGVIITGLRRWTYNHFFARANKVLTLSDAESRVLQREFPLQANRFESVFNPYVTDDLLSLDIAERAAGNGAFEMLTLGRFSPQKNMRRLIAAFAIAKKQDHARGGNLMSKAKLVVAGEGPELEMLEADVARLGLSEQVHFPGYISDVAGLLGKADMFVLSSNYEGLPAVVLEALGSGCRVVSTDCFPAAQELLADLPACAVTERSAEALAEGILKAAVAGLDSAALRARAANYSLDSAVQSHLKAMGL
jgi:glycosyltransferase involved in cell wall biosynthesis